MDKNGQAEIAVSDNCKNPDNHREICVKCNMCRRFCEGCKWKEVSKHMRWDTMCGICTRNPDIIDQYIANDLK